METTSAKGVRMRSEIRAGDIGRIVELHGVVYAEEYGFDHRFEAYVAQTLGEFSTGDQFPGGRLWIAEIDENLVGTIGIVRHAGGAAQLRWLIVHPDARGFGLGRRLVGEAINYSRASGCDSIYLWTVSPLTAAASLYLANGFEKTEETDVRPTWGVVLAEQRYDLRL